VLHLSLHFAVAIPVNNLKDVSKVCQVKWRPLTSTPGGYHVLEIGREIEGNLSLFSSRFLGLLPRVLPYFNYIICDAREVASNTFWAMRTGPRFNCKASHQYALEVNFEIFNRSNFLIELIVFGRFCFVVPLT
jgi:hypothetical protein